MKKILDFCACIMYNNKQVERYEGTVNSKLNIVNLTLQGGCPHIQIAGFYFYRKDKIKWKDLIILIRVLIALLKNVG